ncbi:Kinesin light chain [Seminavis robusta]|uniref:Kinesin light chain n=1 Tax=Seminavis robusta TaxID=568900 RepID=A0A9N8EQB1_9STRA|nr:Kinesin light chain [Seminavis robusta]|eukprot:Sro1430_g271920.1 Kinesin light chain (1447) ;mRNA; f:1144-5575
MSSTARNYTSGVAVALASASLLAVAWKIWRRYKESRDNQEYEIVVAAVPWDRPMGQMGLAFAGDHEGRIYIAEIAEGSPFLKTDIKPNMHVVRINGVVLQPGMTKDQLIQALGKTKDVLTVEAGHLRRQKKVQEEDLFLQEDSVAAAVPWDRPFGEMGLALAEDRDHRVLLYEIAKGSPFLETDIKPGMHILKINGVALQAGMTRHQLMDIFEKTNDVLTIEAGYLRRESSNDPPSNTSTQAQNYLKLGMKQVDNGEYAQAVDSLQKALANQGGMSENAAATYHFLGKALLGTHDWLQAKEAHEKALEIALSGHGESHLQTATCYNDIADALVAGGILSEAVTQYQKSISIHEALLGKGHANTIAAQRKYDAARMKLGTVGVECRERVNAFLAHFSHSIGKDVRLNDEGICAIRYKHLQIVIEVPSGAPNFLIYAILATNVGQDKRLLRKALELNYRLYFEEETRSGCLGMESKTGDMLFCYSDRAAEVTAVDFRNILEMAIDTALMLDKEITMFANAGLKPTKQSETESTAIRTGKDSQEVPRPACPNGHQMHPCPSERKAAGVVCDVCTAKDCAVAFSCSICDFDVGEKCTSKANAAAPLVEATKHFMEGCALFSDGAHEKAAASLRRGLNTIDAAGMTNDVAKTLYVLPLLIRALFLNGDTSGALDECNKALIRFKEFPALPKPDVGVIEQLISDITHLRDEAARNPPRPDMIPKPDADLMGVSVHHLKTTFMAHVRMAGFDKSSKIYELENLGGPMGVIRRKGVGVLCPMDGKEGAAYVHCLSGGENIGKASVMISYTWGYAIGDIVATLDDYCEANRLDPKHLYVWICCLCNNQHRIVEDRKAGKEVPFEEFRRIFYSRVTGVGHVLPMMAPWNSPRYLTRVWCIFEIFTALKEGCQVSIVMPPEEKEGLEQTMFSSDLDFAGDVDMLYDVLAKTKVQQADASVEEDRVRVLRLVEDNPGYRALNDQVINSLRSWVRSVIEDLIQKKGSGKADDLEYALFCKKLGFLFQRNGENEAAFEWLMKAGTMFTNACGPNHPYTASTMIGLGKVLLAQGDITGAKVELTNALKILDPFRLGKCQDAEAADAYHNLGIALQLQGFLKAAQDNHTKALEIRQSVFGDVHPKVALSHQSIGSILAEEGNHPQALHSHRLALSIREKFLGRDHADTSASYIHVSSQLFQLGQREQALALLQEVYEAEVGSIAEAMRQSQAEAVSDPVLQSSIETIEKNLVQCSPEADTGLTSSRGAKTSQETKASLVGVESFLAGSKGTGLESFSDIAVALQGLNDLDLGALSQRVSSPEDRSAAKASRRTIIDNHLERISRSAGEGKSFRLNAKGIGAFVANGRPIVIEAPHTPSFFVWTTLLKKSDQVNQDHILQKVMEMNYLQQQTRGGGLLLDPVSGDVVFVFSERTDEISYTDFCNILSNFIETVESLATALQTV